uniref:Phosphate-specific transport system accessory protein PhoU n=1 Tax=Candidatus Kentrum sp. TUN TaxID=2126343 RepID=A0A450ZVY6_9GAMM|nr:MAG: phosphate uptake regulator, PhoU [Candidatus Kentron sp. TUN]VFK62808.1 MAG: phosphate uptake regulator, PhoU [Candidatus Kentron sp. TUN]VFK67028.1 MAG: phosphate uptake regulator, PhoU [Candidatus Kentron sp. TUN]
MKLHTVHSFDEELESIRDRVMAMGELTKQQLSDALITLTTKDGSLAEMVISKDKKLNRMELDIDNDCTFLLARRTPVAFDLRLVISILKIINDLERIGDLAKEIAQTTLTFSGDIKSLKCLPLLEGMGEQVKKMLHKALDALARSDTQAAAELYRDDRQINSHHDAILQHMLTLAAEGPHDIPSVLRIFWVTRALERAGDRCRNIGEYIIYLVEGRDVRHAKSVKNKRNTGS